MSRHTASSPPSGTERPPQLNAERPPPAGPAVRSGSGPLAQALRFAGAGLELSGMALAMAAIGYAIDRHYQHTTLIATAFGTMIGFSAGMYRFIRQALAAGRTSAVRDLNRPSTEGSTADRSGNRIDDRPTADRAER